MSAAAPVPSLPKSPRDARLDVIRGLCLVMIFINHTPGNPLEDWTSRNFGFSDAAEGFVMMSGIAAGLAYGPDFRPGVGRIVTGITRLWARAWTLYQVHILTCMGALAMVAFSAKFLGAGELLFENNMRAVWKRPLETLIGLPLLTHQFGYVNILPMYLVMMLAAPLAMWAAWRWPARLWAGSVVLWALAAWFRLGLPNYPQPGLWFFNPLSWQLIFVTGLLIGVHIRQGRRLVAVTRGRVWAAGAFLAVSALLVQHDGLNVLMGRVMWFLQDKVGLPWFLTAFDKTYVSGLRLLHILTLTYLLSALPVVSRAAAHRFAAPLALMGRQALPVFALGSITCFGAQGLHVWLGGGAGAGLFVVGLGLALQLALAAARQYWPKGRVAPPAAVTG